MKFLRMLRRRRTLRMGLAILLDLVTPIQPGRITFVTRANVPFAGNVRIVADALARHSDLDIAVYKDGPIPKATMDALAENGIRVYSEFSLGSLRRILSSETIVLSHSARDAFLSRRRKRRRIINLWHGVALKRIEGLMRADDSSPTARMRRRLISRNGRLYDVLVASSPVDRLVNALAFGVPYERVHAVGLPRYDYLRAGWPLPSDLRQQKAELSAILAGRRLVLYAPTFREVGCSVLDWMDAACLEKLRAMCQRNGLVLGIRPHPYERQPLATICDGDDVIDASAMRFPEAAILLAQAYALVVDYSSIWVDFLTRRKPVLGLVPDYALYRDEDRGFIYDQDKLFPGPMFHEWDGLIGALELYASNGFAVEDSARHEATARWLLPSDVDGRPVSERCLDLIMDS